MAGNAFNRLGPSEFNQFDEGWDASQGRFDQFTRQRAGNALAGGDYAGGANALFRGGMLSEGADVQKLQQGNEDRVKAQGDAKRKEQLEFTAKAIDALDRVGQSGGDVTGAFDSLVPAFEGMEPDPARRAQVRQQMTQLRAALGQNPKAVLAALRDTTAKELQAVNMGNGGFGTFNTRTGAFNVVREPDYEQKYATVPEGGKLVPIPRGNQPASTVDPFAGGGPAPARGSASASQADQVTAAVAPLGLTLNSAVRSPGQNRAAGGVGNSYHLAANGGLARDYQVPPNMTLAQAKAAVEQNLPDGWEAIAEPPKQPGGRGHIHIEPRSGAAPSRVAQAGDPPGTIYGAPKPEDPLKALQAENLQGQITERAQKITETAEKRTRGREAAEAKATSIIAAVDTALSKIGRGEAGFIGAKMSEVPGTKAYDVARQIDTIKANLGFQELQAMREASPTGGALGAIAVQELTALQATVASLDMGQSEGELKASLGKIKSHYQKWLGTVDAQPAQGDSPPARTAAPPAARAQGGSPPASALKPGHITTFANGQRWTLRNGKPARVQ
jgi:hypothetical protein